MEPYKERTCGECLNRMKVSGFRNSFCRLRLLDDDCSLEDCQVRKYDIACRDFEENEKR